MPWLNHFRDPLKSYGRQYTTLCRRCLGVHNARNLPKHLKLHDEVHGIPYSRCDVCGVKADDTLTGYYKESNRNDSDEDPAA